MIATALILFQFFFFKNLNYNLIVREKERLSDPKAVIKLYGLPAA